MSRSIRLAIAALAILAGVPARADSITLLSGPPGLAEGTQLTKPFIEAIDGVAGKHKEPVVVTDTTRWALPFEGGSAAYVSSCPTCGSDLNRCSGASGWTPATITLVHRFDLPATFTTPSLTMTTTNDDSADVFLNGNYVGSATTFGWLPGGVTFTLTATDPAFFRPGDNELRYELKNFNAPCPLSAAYRAVIDYTP